IAADTKAVAVAAGHQYGQIVISKLHARGHCERPAVQSVHAVGVDEARSVGRTANAADSDHVMVRDLELDQGLLECGKHTKIAATGTPVGIDFAFQIGHHEVLGGGYNRRHVLSSSNHDFMRGNGKFGLPTQLFFHGFDNVVRHERFAIVFSDMSVRHVAGFTAQVAGELTAVVVLHDDGVPRVFENVENRLAVQRYQPADLKLIGRNALLGEDFAGLFDYPHGRSPADQSDLGIARTRQRRRRNCGLNAVRLPHTLFHHGAALRRVSEFVADQDAIFVVFVTRGSVRVTGNARNGARRDTAFGNLVPLVRAVAVRPRWGGRRSDQLPTINNLIKVQVLRIHAEPALRQQQIAKYYARALKSIRDIEDLRDNLEAIPNIERGGDNARIVSESSAQHLPKIALLSFGGDPGGGSCTLA